MDIGIIGCGRRLKCLLRDFGGSSGSSDGSGGIRIKAIADPNTKDVTTALNSLGHHPQVFEDYQQLLQQEDIDWVLIGSPNHLHREHAIAAMEAGKHVFCEKPLATSLEDCLAIRATQERTGRKFFIGFTLRYSPHYVRIKQLLDDGAIGQLISMEFNETLAFNHGGFIHQDWRRLTQFAGTHLLEKCCHDIDVANWFTGSLPTRVASFGGLNFFTPDNAHHIDRVGPDPATGKPAFMAYLEHAKNPFTIDKDIVDNQVAILEYASGVRSTFHTNCCAGQPERRNYLVGTEGTIQADMVTGDIRVRRIGWDTPTTTYNAQESGSIDAHGGADPKLIQWLIECMRGEASPRTGIEEGMKSALTCFALDQAMRSKSVVELAPTWKQVGIDND